MLSTTRLLGSRSLKSICLQHWSSSSSSPHRLCMQAASNHIRSNFLAQSRYAPHAGPSRGYASRRPSVAPFDPEKLVAEIKREAEEMARNGVGFDAEVNDPFELMEEMETDKTQFTIDEERVRQVHEYARTHWHRYRNLPSGWRCNWGQWELLLTFYYPTPYYFLLVPQIDIVVNVRYALPGEVRPVMFNNDLESFMFEIVERRLDPGPADKNPVEQPRKLYYMDWKNEELYLVENASTVKAAARQMIVNGGLKALKLKLLQCDSEGEQVIDRILDEDESVVPILTEKYLGYTPAPAEELTNKYLDRSEEVMEELGLGDLDSELEKQDPKLRKQGKESYNKIMSILSADMSDDPVGLELTAELLEGVKDMAPEEMAPLHDLLKVFKDLKPEQGEIVADEVRKYVRQLERELAQDGKVLGELVKEAERSASQSKPKP